MEVSKFGIFARIHTVSKVSILSHGNYELSDSSIKSYAVTNLGKSQGLLCCDVAPDGLTVAAGTELQGEDALILYWYTWSERFSSLS